jgi:outer membrane protein assembly factor BamB
VHRIDTSRFAKEIGMRPLLVLPALLLASLVRADDWPHWMGPRSDGTSAEKGLATTWPDAGPKVLWKAAGGDGYSAIAVAGDRAITMVQRGGKELVVALDADAGKELWSTPLGPAFKNANGSGPRATPWIEGDRVYVQSVSGPVACLDAKTGTIVWQKNLLKEFGAKNITWGLSASPVIDGNILLVIPGAKNAGVAALDKRTGETLWKTGSDKAAYASPVVADVGGVKQAIFFTAAGLLGVSLDKGAELWRIDWPAEFDCNIATPLLLPGNKLFVSSGEGNGCALLQLQPMGAPKTVWESKGKNSVMICYWATPIAHEGHLYGFAGEFDKRIDFRCIDLADGKVKWSKEGFGKGALLYADGQLIATTKAGDLVLVRATPTAYEERARVELLGSNRTVPTLSRKRLYVRDLANILCLDVGS